jgi:hypothetical protein
MIEALLHGKLSREQESMEDLLTSNVFGMLQYVPPELGVLPLLAEAVTVSGDHPLASLRSTSNRTKTKATYEFWPRWAGCEPDVVLQLLGNDGSHFLIAVEAKYLSGKSSQADFAEILPCDQLACEWIHLVKRANELGARPYLIYLTSHICCPEMEIRSSIEEHLVKSVSTTAEPSICWLSWRQLSRLFGNNFNPILSSIARMAEKMGLTFFYGMTKIASVHLDWNFLIKKTWNFRIAPISVSWRFKNGRTSKNDRQWIP